MESSHATQFVEGGLADTNRTLVLQTPYMQGADVREAQQKLISAGFGLPEYGPDGKYGPETAGAVRRFQQDRGLAVTGSIDAVTWAELNKVETTNAVTGSGSTDGDSNWLLWGGLAAVLGLAGLGIAMNKKSKDKNK